MKILERIVQKPRLLVRNGVPYTCFNRVQAWIYPELCKKQFNEALKHLNREQQVEQRKIAKVTFGW